MKLEIVERPELGYFAVIDATDEEKEESNNYGILCDGVPTREAAEQFIAEWKAEQEARRVRAALDQDDEFPDLETA